MWFVVLNSFVSFFYDHLEDFYNSPSPLNTQWNIPRTHKASNHQKSHLSLDGESLGAQYMSKKKKKKAKGNETRHENGYDK